MDGFFDQDALNYTSERISSEQPTQGLDGWPGKVGSFRSLEVF